MYIYVDVCIMCVYAHVYNIHVYNIHACVQYTCVHYTCVHANACMHTHTKYVYIHVYELPQLIIYEPMTIMHVSTHTNVRILGTNIHVCTWYITYYVHVHVRIHTYNVHVCVST